MINQTNKVNQSKEELLLHLNEQLQFLKKSARDYDRGDTTEAKRMAVCIRILLHDKRSASLLHQLNIKEKILFLNSALPFNPKNIIPYMGLLMINVTSNQTQTISTYQPLLDKGPPIRPQKEWLTFDDWWEKSFVLTDQKQNRFSRKDLILNVADTDGGAHVDGKLNKTYADLSRNNSLGITFVTKKSSEPEKIDPLKYAELASVRQIAYEFLESFEQYRINEGN